MKIAVGADHAGFALKEELKKHLSGKGFAIEDCGTHSAEPVDYPVYAHAVAVRVGEKQCDRGIIIDGAGIGSCIVANKVSGVRAASCHDLTSAKNSREHNDANVLTLGAGLIGLELARQIADIWLTTECTVERHKRRVAMITEIERGNPPPVQPAASAIPELEPDDIRRIAEKIQSLIGGSCRVVDGDIVCSSGQNIFIHYGHPTKIDPDSVKNMIDAGAGRIGYTPDGNDLPSGIAELIDHTLLSPQATPDQIKKLCEEAIAYKFATVCVNPCHVKLCWQLLRGSPVKVCSVVGFPFGANTSEIKAMEARRAIRDGAGEIDMVINIGALKAGDDETVLRDIMAVTEACRDGGALSKVIIETAFLTDDEKVRACKLAKKARADFVKTSTGYGPGGATVHDVALMSQAVRGTKMGVKASGGIRSYADARKMIQAGATRIGASAGVKITQEAGKITVSE